MFSRPPFTCLAVPPDVSYSFLLCCHRNDGEKDTKQSAGIDIRSCAITSNLWDPRYVLKHPNIWPWSRELLAKSLQSLRWCSSHDVKGLLLEKRMFRDALLGA